MQRQLLVVSWYADMDDTNTKVEITNFQRAGKVTGRAKTDQVEGW